MPTRMRRCKVPNSVAFILDARELRELRRAARREKVPMAIVARMLTLAYFGVKPRVRLALGPRAAGAKRLAQSMKRRVAS